MDKKQEFVKELEQILSEELNNTSSNPIYEQIKSLYPQISIKKICDNIDKELSEFNAFIEIVKLAQQYKECCDYILEKEATIKLADLLTIVDASVVFDGFDRKELDIVTDRMFDTKMKLDSLGFKNFSILENERIKKQKTSTVLERNGLNDEAYYNELFSLSNDESELITLYCNNTDYEQGVNKQRLKLIHNILLNKKCSVTSDFQFFETRVRKRYRALGLNY